MNIAWLSSGNISIVDGKPYSDLASARYRMTIPAMEMSTRGAQIELLNIDQNTTEHSFEQINHADVVIFGKTFNKVAKSLLNRVKKAGVSVVFDLCDNHFERNKSEFYRYMAQHADLIVASTPEMARIAAKYSEVPIQVISDPYEGVRGEALSRIDEPLNLLWFGSHTNIDSLLSVIPELETFARDSRVELSVVTSPIKGLEKAIHDFHSHTTSGLRMTFVKWSLDTMPRQMHACHAVIIPSTADERRAVKSPNRLIESAWAGRFVVAHPVPAYQPFAQWMYVGESITRGLEDMRENVANLSTRIRDAQSFIQEHHSPAVIAGHWMRVCEALKKNA
ncbi:MAG: hypothetical protein OEZ43_08035 [Gammaproteobacteria bacterium]|nr:hypothetical protein [Gammaproteobacteria bacterium]